MKIGITGASGMLGTALINELSNKHEVFATARKKGVEKENINWQCFDLTDIQKLKKWLVDNNPDVVVHCAALVNVDECEKNESYAELLHIQSTKVLSEYLVEINGTLIYISTDSVFDGDKLTPYTEIDKPNPVNIYAQTKLYGENYVLSMKNGLVLRTNIIGWSRTNSISFAEWVLKGLIEQKPLTLFKDVLFSPLHVDDLSKVIIRAIEKKVSGLFNASSKDWMSKYNFGLIMADVFRMPIDNIIETSSDEFLLKAKRPKNMILSNKKLSKLIGYDFPTIRDAINLMEKQYRNY